MKIFLGGSRDFEHLPSELIEWVNIWMQDSAEFLVGDSRGADRAFQGFLVKQKYPRVKVFSSVSEARNNLGDWPFEYVDSGLKSKSKSVHAFKDRSMTNLADAGLMIWDSVSAGTLSNVIDLVRSGKDCSVWFVPDAEMFKFDNPNSLERWLAAYPDARDEAQRRLSTFDKREAKRKSEDFQPDLFT